jgi:hypothetical protein
MDVMMDFLTEEQMEEMRGLLHEESLKISTTRLQTHIYVRNAEATAKLFQEKCRETRTYWRQRLFPLPEPCVLSHESRS